MPNGKDHGTPYVGLRQSCGIDDEDEFATKFNYNNGNNASTDNITAGVAAQRRSGVAGRVGDTRRGNALT